MDESVRFNPNLQSLKERTRWLTWVTKMIPSLLQYKGKLIHREIFQSVIDVTVVVKKTINDRFLIFE